jgi:hypothetical protein
MHGMVYRHAEADETTLLELLACSVLMGIIQLEFQ